MKSLAQRTYWIFDMDGTLTMPVHDFDAIRAELNIEQGRPILEAISTMPANVAEQAHRKLHALEMELAASAIGQPNVEEFLAHLRKRDCTLGVLTRNAGDIARATLHSANLAHFFNENDILARDDCPPKPDPAGILLLLRRWQAQASDAVMVGDYLFDIEAGKRANVATVHFDTESQFNWPEWTDFAVSSFRQLGELCAHPSVLQRSNFTNESNDQSDSFCLENNGKYAKQD